jgi:hypothetical protein
MERRFDWQLNVILQRLDSMQAELNSKLNKSAKRKSSKKKVKSKANLPRQTVFTPPSYAQLPSAMHTSSLPTTLGRTAHNGLLLTGHEPS